MKHFPDEPAFSESNKIIGRALKAEAAGHTPYARLLGIIGLKVFAAATQRYAVGAFQRRPRA